MIEKKKLRGRPKGSASPNRITSEQKIKVLEAIAKSGNYTVAAQHAGTTRATIWAESKRDKKFAADILSARDAYADVLEAILDSRIKNDKDKMGAILLMFSLKANRPDKYRELSTVKHEGDIRIISGVPRPVNNPIIKDIKEPVKQLLEPPSDNNELQNDNVPDDNE